VIDESQKEAAMLHIEKLEQVLSEIIARWGIPGLGVGIVEGEEIVYARGFGVQSLDTQAPVTPSSIFCVASVSKCFVATAIMQLVEQGKIDLDIPIVKYLSYFRLDDDRYTQITIRQILNHTSGMPDMDEAEYDELVYHPETDEGAAERYVRGLQNRKMVGAPGERFAYSNIAYNVLGDLIAKVAEQTKGSGQTFEEYMKKHVLLPSGMPDSTFFFPEVPRDRLAVPHLRTPEMVVNPVYPYHRADAPASFLHSTTIDMCHWSITSLNGGEYNGNRILSADRYPLMWTPIAPRSYPPFYEHAGLGWTLGHYEGVKTVSHGGGGFGWTNFLILLPEKKRGAVILCNEESSARENTILAVVDAMLGREPQVGPVAWMIPISQALQRGGIQAAYACYDEIKSSQEYFFDADELVNLTLQLTSVKKIDLAIDVLGLNIHAFPEHFNSYLSLARLYLIKSKCTLAEETLRKALSIRPQNSTALDLLAKIRAGEG
jgi:CubicO group peptidase (beta-lactamase class C family)